MTCLLSSILSSDEVYSLLIFWFIYNIQSWLDMDTFLIICQFVNEWDQHYMSSHPILNDITQECEMWFGYCV